LSTAVPGGTVPRVRILVGAVIAALATVGLLVPAEGIANGGGDPPPPTAKKRSANVTVMTRNVYLGADLGPAINADSIPEAISGAGEIYRELESTNFPERAVPLAKEIRKAKPDLVGLQEVAHWRVQDPSDGGAPPISPIGELATDTKYDFLELLMKRLKQYKVVAVQEEFEGELPADIDDDPNTGTGPLAAFGADIDVRLTMQDVILQRKSSRVKTRKKSVKQDHYDELFTADVGGVEITALRGWQKVEASVKPRKKGKAIKFRFVNTHLEAFGDPKIREAQAKELTQKGGPLRTKKRVILVGDLNSGIKKHNIGAGGGGSADPDDQLAFRALKKFGMRDYGAVHSCCYSAEDMFNPDAKFTHTVDHVLANKRAKAKKIRAYVTGNDRKEITPSGLWPSDHGGVVSKLKLRR
jgi:endonuclease/exonuclease/phosphatase family metal-dependent hydrolase